MKTTLEECLPVVKDVAEDEHRYRCDTKCTDTHLDLEALVKRMQDLIDGA